MAKNLICVFPFLVLIFACFSQSSQAYQFIVGGKDGWVLSPSESYSQWAGRNRFSVNDTLYNCSTGNPILKLDDGNSVFKIDRSGPFYFITGTKDNCDKGQKLVIVVLAVRSPPTPPTATAPSPNGLSTPPPSTSPAASPNQSPSPANQVSGPPSTSPAASPNQSPSPANQVSGPPSPSPAASPNQSPSPANQVSGPPPPEANPRSPPSTTTPGSPGTSVPGGGNTTAADNAPPGPGSFAAPACSPKVVLVLGVSLVLSLSFVISP